MSAVDEPEAEPERHIAAAVGCLVVAFLAVLVVVYVVWLLPAGGMAGFD
jgi:hypothetical protein